MTTEKAEQLYLAQHEYEWEGVRIAIYNPKGKAIGSLPVIYGFNNGGSPGWYEAVAMAEDGTYLGGHICSHEGYIPYDLGILDGARLDRHENDYQRHYPEGYRMEFVPTERIENHETLQLAFKRCRESAKALKE